jgi:adenylate cyclase, class 2
MQRSTREIEIKLRFDSPDEARRILERAGATRVGERMFEDNVIYDNGTGALEAARKVLRLRRYGEVATLTFKAPVEGSFRHKVREEHETVVGDPEEVDALLAGLGFKPVYRYQKFRTHYEIGGLAASLDETPVGCFVELEGAPEAIDRTAEKMGATPAEYVLSNYRELHEEQARARGERAGDLVFDRGGEDRA